MPLDWSQQELADGLRCYAAGQFFEAHEHWEAVWLRLHDPEKAFLQGLIQVAAAFHHLQRGNTLGTKSLLRAALNRLDPLPDEFGGVAVASLRKSIRAWLAVLNAGNASRPPFPKIR